MTGKLARAMLLRLSAVCFRVEITVEDTSDEIFSPRSIKRDSPLSRILFSGVLSVLLLMVVQIIQICLTMQRM